MLSKEDYTDYLSQIEKAEKDMRDAYSFCVSKAEDGRIKNVCIKLLEDETKRVHMVEDMKKMLDL